jgi:hypothetical protein
MWYTGILRNLTQFELHKKQVMHVGRMFGRTPAQRTE